ncbi:hypothetical protein AYO44_13555 [Planctomycetaceae bacterium SCGC AG-212-F19]|nr:hypothetical protein AYO44_13555 [Planctomycetaceae bacterium SCGC AG-212-F19]
MLLPSFTFASTANAVVRVGARPRFVDIRPDTLNIDELAIEQAITPRTRAIFVVHYAGVGCEMAPIMAIARRYGLRVVEDAVQAVNASVDGCPLGSIGHLGCYSFHATKNYVCGSGGALCVNDPEFEERAHVIRDRGTSRLLTGRRVACMSREEQQRLLWRMHRVPPGLINAALGALCAFETPAGHLWRFPWGTSVLAVL